MEQTQLIRSARGEPDTMLEELRKILGAKNISSQGAMFRSTFTKLMDNEKFREFMIKGSKITQEEYDKNKSDILNAPGETGKKMRKFLAYALNKSDVKSSNNVAKAEDIDEYLLKKFGSVEIQASTPLIAKSNNSDTAEKSAE